METSKTGVRKRFGVVLGAAVMTGVLALAVIGPPMASGQATRTWVSGVGDDVNPCARTAPCKTFAGAISKTAAGGEINCLDPGGFGAVTITKAMTIDCLYTEGGALAGGNGIVINAQPTDVVFLRGLDIFGVNPPTHGVRFIAGAALHLDNMRIQRFNAANSAGVSFAPSGASELFISNSVIHDNGDASTGGGIVVQPTGTGSAKVTLDNVQLVNNFQGFRADTAGSATNSIKVTINGSTASHNTGHGFAAIAAGGPVEMLITDSVSSYNLLSGIIANSAAALVRMANTAVTGNTTGTNQSAGGVIQSYGNNQVRGNTNDGSRVPITQE
ncbi:MAG: right-handed parallel beta-helix repeat-containing protein [Candidatus Limnocylindrales bacterium]